MNTWPSLISPLPNYLPNCQEPEAWASVLQMCALLPSLASSIPLLPSGLFLLLEAPSDEPTLGGVSNPFSPCLVSGAQAWEGSGCHRGLASLVFLL